MCSCRCHICLGGCAIVVAAICVVDYGADVVIMGVLRLPLAVAMQEVVRK